MYESTNEGQDIHTIIEATGNRKTTIPTISTQLRPRADRRFETRSILTCSLRMKV